MSESEAGARKAPKGPGLRAWLAAAFGGEKKRKFSCPFIARNPWQKSSKFSGKGRSDT